MQTKPEAWQRGYDDERKGLRFLDNPYTQDSTAARVWVDGYVQSMADRRKADSASDA